MILCLHAWPKEQRKGAARRGRAEAGWSPSSSSEEEQEHMLPGQLILARSISRFCVIQWESL